MQRPPRCRGPFAVFVAFLFVLVGCGHDAGRAAPVSAPPTELRHDVGPLVSRFAELGTPVSASWVTWNSGGGPDDRVPGPTTSWLDAVVRLDPVTWLRLKTQYDPKDQGHRPEVPDPLRPALPKGPFLTGGALDAAFTTPGLATYAYLDSESNNLVLLSTSM